MVTRKPEGVLHLILCLKAFYDPSSTGRRVNSRTRAADSVAADLMTSIRPNPIRPRKAGEIKTYPVFWWREKCHRTRVNLGRTVQRTRNVLVGSTVLRTQLHDRSTVICIHSTGLEFSLCKTARANVARHTRLLLAIMHPVENGLQCGRSAVAVSSASYRPESTNKILVAAC
jgi:hypothetical protein